MLAKFHQILRFGKFSVNLYRNSTHRKFPEFWFKSSFEYGEIFIRKVVPYPKLFLSIFYLEFLEHGKAFWISQSLGQINLIQFENRIGRTVLPTLPVSASLTASPHRTQPLTIRPPSHPGPPVSHVTRVTPTPPSSTVARQCAARTRHGRAAAMPTTYRHTALCHARAPPLSLSLFRSASTRRPPLCPPPCRFSLKWSRRPPTKDFSHPARHLSRRPRLSAAPSFPSPRR
jgi:hypothetical protein